jgi:hypothetical protein
MNWLRRQLDELIALLCMMVGISPPEEARKRLMQEKDRQKDDKQ